MAETVVGSAPIRFDAVVARLPPVQLGAPTTIRNEPFALGRKLTCTVVEFTTEAVTLWPPAVIAASEPKVRPEGCC